MGLGALRRSMRRNAVRRSPEGDAILALHDDLEGLLSIEESAFLYNAAKNRKTIVEIGSYRGKSGTILALGSAAVAGRVTAIDPHLTYDDGAGIVFNPEDEQILRDALTRHGVADRVDHWVTGSAEARERWPSDQPIDLLWIDGDHSEAGAKRDFELWAPLVRPGGILAAHDVHTWPDVKRAWDAVIPTLGYFDKPRRVRSIAWATRTG